MAQNTQVLKDPFLASEFYSEVSIAVSKCAQLGNQVLKLDTDVPLYQNGFL